MAIAAVVAEIEQRIGDGRHGRHRHSRDAVAGHRPGQERQLGLADRPAAARPISRPGSDAPVRIANDANCFVVSEATDGAAAGADGRLRRHRRHRHRRRDRGPRRVADRPARHRRRVGAQSAALAARPMSGRGRRATAARPGASRRSSSGPGLARDYQQRTGQAAERRQTDRSQRLMPRRRGGAGALREPDGAGAGGDHQRPRPRRHRPRRRAVEYRPALRERAAALVRGTSSRRAPAREPVGPASCRRVTAMPAGCAARRGCGGAVEDRPRAATRVRLARRDLAARQDCRNRPPGRGARSSRRTSDR